MSSLEQRNSVPFRRLAAVALASLALAGCFRPLYAELPGGGNVRNELAAIEVAPIVDRLGQERIGHYLRQELVFDLDGSGRTSEKRYTLVISNVSEQLVTATLNTETGRADSAVLTGSASFILTSIGGAPIISGVARASATYDRSPQRFSNLRAARDAEIKIAKLIAEQIQTRLAATLVSRS